MPYDLLIRNVRVVRPSSIEDADIAITGEKFAKIGRNLGEARNVYDGKGYLAFPGVVDAHMHTGIYSPLEEDAVSESRAAAQGGVTSSLNYFRTGQYYLNRGGPWRDFLPEVLNTAAGRFHVDYGFHLAPMDSTHIREIPEVVQQHGISSFKIFMFYGSHGLHGRSDSQRDFLMIGPEERYDLAHFEFVMRGVQAARERFRDKAGQISLSLHGALATHQDWLAGPFRSLAELGRVVAVDRPGHGASRRRRFEAGPRAQAAQIRQGLAAVGTRRLIILGHSFGSRTALAYAELYPDEVAELILIAPAAFPEIRPFEHFALAPRATPVLGPLWARMMAFTFDRPLLEAVHQMMFAPQEPDDRWRRTYPWEGILDPDQTVAQGEEFVDLHPFGRPDPIDFSKIQTPVHILAGTGDLILRDQWQARPLSTILPNARLTLLEGIGHMLHHSRPDAVVGATEEALQQQRRL